LVLLLVIALYGAIFLGSITKLWGIDYTVNLTHYASAFDRGLKPILDTTFLSALATPIAGLAGMIIAYLVVRKTFSGKEAVDFSSNLGGAVPGTILGIGYIIAFIQAPLIVVAIIFVALAYYLVRSGTTRYVARLAFLLLGTLIGLGINFLSLNEKARQPLLTNALIAPMGALPVIDQQTWTLVLAALLVLVALGSLVFSKQLRRAAFIALVLMAFYLLTNLFIRELTSPLVPFGKELGGNIWPKVFASLAAWINLFFQPPLALVGFTYTVIAGFIIGLWSPRARPFGLLALLAVCAALTFVGETLALVGTPYIILAASRCAACLPRCVQASPRSNRSIPRSRRRRRTWALTRSSLSARSPCPSSCPRLLPA
jgi:iron(III) transport system permease protein